VVEHWSEKPGVDSSILSPGIFFLYGSVSYAEHFETVSLAQKRERFFKTGKGRSVLKSLLNDMQVSTVSRH
jgi:hypothetical protein